MRGTAVYQCHCYAIVERVRAVIPTFPMIVICAWSEAARLFWPMRQTACLVVCLAVSVFYSSHPSPRPPLLPVTDANRCDAVRLGAAVAHGHQDGVADRRRGSRYRRVRARKLRVVAIAAPPVSGNAREDRSSHRGRRHSRRRSPAAPNPFPHNCRLARENSVSRNCMTAV